MDRKYKVLQLCAVGFTVEKLLLPLVNEMSKDYDVTVVCSYDLVTDRLRTKGYKIHNIEIDRRIDPFKNLKSIIGLYKLMKKEKFDIVHVHTPVAGILGRIAAKLARVPVVIYTAHGFYFHDNMKRLKKNIFIAVEKLGGLLSHYIFTQSMEDYHTAIEKGIIKKSKITAIGNGVDIEKFSMERIEREKSPEHIREQLGIKKDEIVVGIIGRVVKEKGYMEWVQAAEDIIKKYPFVKFLAVGDTLESDRDGVKKELDEFIENANLKGNIVFLGSRSDIPEILSAIDIFTLPSYREGMPRSLIEAMCMSKPAVATDIRGCREEVVEGVTGFMVPVGDAKALADKIRYLIENPDERRKMGRSARLRAEEEFDERIVIKRQMDVIARLVKERIPKK
ncbi:MAG: glycosyltransferase family 4 protein [Clostridia bacterium]|nr:glycosyltransferase family 4 protein [Clostridia bacterium]